MKVYFISGLGADERVFQHIQLPAGFDIVHLSWIAPDKDESLSAYAARLAKKIDRNEPFALLGLSMGGMICSSMNALFRQDNLPKPAVTILISSVPGKQFFPKHYAVARRYKLYRLIPVGLLKSASILNRLFMPDTPENKAILQQVIRDSDKHFIRWAIPAILHWDNETAPEPFIHIHGSKDKIFPLQYVQPTHIIKHAGHLMIMNEASRINQILAATFSSLPSA